MSGTTEEATPAPQQAPPPTSNITQQPRHQQPAVSSIMGSTGPLDLCCPVCGEMFVDPVTLPCCHSMCMRCVGSGLVLVGAAENQPSSAESQSQSQGVGGAGPTGGTQRTLRESGSGGLRLSGSSGGGGGLRVSARSMAPRSALICPVCKAECSPKSACINKQLCVIIEEMRKSDNMCEDHPTEPAVPATVICQACMPPLRLCDECNLRVHHGARFRCHLAASVVPLKTAAVHPARMFCRKHTSELVRFYCPVHDMILCQLCVCDDHARDDCISIESAAEECRSRLKKKCRTIHEVLKYVSNSAQPFALSAAMIAKKQEFIANNLTALCEKLQGNEDTRITEVKSVIQTTLTNDVNKITEQHTKLSVLVRSLCTQLSELESATHCLPDTILIRKRNELSELLDDIYNRVHAMGASEVGHTAHGNPSPEFLLIKEAAQQLMSFPGEVYDALYALPEHSDDKGCTELCTIAPMPHSEDMYLLPQIGSNLCKDHHQPLTMFCKEDSRLVCGHCLHNGAHGSHECVPLPTAICPALEELAALDVNITKLLDTALAHQKQAESTANLLQKSALQTGHEAISVLNKIVTTWHNSVLEMFSSIENQLRGALQQQKVFETSIFETINRLSALTSQIQCLRNFLPTSSDSTPTSPQSTPPSTTSTSSSSTTATKVDDVSTATEPTHEQVAFMHAYLQMHPRILPPRVPDPPVGLDKLASKFPRLTECEAALQQAKDAVVAKEADIKKSEAQHASLAAQLQNAHQDNQMLLATIEELKAEAATLRGVDFARAADGSANLLNDVITGGACKVAQYAFAGGAGTYKSNCGGPTEAWCANGCLIDTEPTSRTRSVRGANSVGSTWTNNTSGGTGILVVDMGRAAHIRTLVFFQMCSDGKTTRMRLSYHPAARGAAAPAHDAGGWTDWGHGWVEVADLVNCHDNSVDASNTWQVSFTTQFLKIEVQNSGAYGSASYIELRQLKAFST
ncbi:hypothetical protein Pelo_12339 [Pelomyxa schiedti]|nr:hypothetical protein Pelo_12339 [Pelomyxa schiedti]